MNTRLECLFAKLKVRSCVGLKRRVFVEALRMREDDAASNGEVR